MYKNFSDNYGKEFLCTVNKINFEIINNKGKKRDKKDYK